MDPEVCLKCAEEACAEGDYREASSCLEDYWAWRKSDGFEPTQGDARALLLAGQIVVADVRNERE